jgi:hypothetical protein
MSLARSLSPSSVESLSWAQICKEHPNEWVCLLDVDMAPDGSIQNARVVVHASSMRQALAQLGAPQPNTLVAHTSGRPLQSPRIELSDEIRDLVRPRR